jgi:hypothetical protein
MVNSQTYREVAAVPDSTADRSIEGWNTALSAVLLALESDVRDAL